MNLFFSDVRDNADSTRIEESVQTHSCLRHQIKKNPRFVAWIFLLFRKWRFLHDKGSHDFMDNLWTKEVKIVYWESRP